MNATPTNPGHQPWNKGKLVGQKAPLRLKDIWAIRVRLQIAEKTRDLALFNLAIDSKLRACDLVKLRVRDIAHGDRVASRAIVMQQKTQCPVQFEITEQTRDPVGNWIRHAMLRAEDFLFPSRLHDSDHLSTVFVVRHRGSGQNGGGRREKPGTLLLSAQRKRHRMERWKMVEVAENYMAG